MSDRLFGNDVAEHDDILDECYVERPFSIMQAPILTGKWGTGKSAILLQANKEIMGILGTKNADFRLLWYMNEGNLNVEEISTLQQSYHVSDTVFRLALERLWRAEIARLLCRLLFELYEYYGMPPGKHWEYIRRIAKVAPITESIWQQVSSALQVIFGGDRDCEHPLIRFKHNFEDLYVRRVLPNVRKCAEDVRALGKPLPIIAIEPIDSPTSVLEESKGLAQIMVTSLLDVFQKEFQPSHYQPIQVRISIPWHRYIVDKLGSPQKVEPHVATISWRKAHLQKLINRRIEWEIRNLRQPGSAKTGSAAWESLFGRLHVNRFCTSRIEEETLTYFLRHTHHRARDLMEIVRTAVEEQAIERAYPDPHNVLADRNIPKVSPSCMRNAVKKYCNKWFPIRLTEAYRRYPHLQKDEDLLFGLPVPCSRDTWIDERLMRRRGIGYGEAVEISEHFWDAGIVGIQLIAHTSEAKAYVRERVDEETLPKYYLEGTVNDSIWYLFDYNTEEGISAALKRFETAPDVECNIVLHPMGFEHFGAHTSRDYPVGV